MKKNKLILSLAFALLCLLSCDDTTDGIGTSIIDNLDNINVTCDTFSVASRTVVSGPVYSRSTTGYLGNVKDPETKANVKGHFTTQFYTLENTELPSEKSIASRLKDGSVIADSCIIYLYYNSYFGDSLSAMKVKMMELDKPMEENMKYYSDFNPETMCRTDKGAVNVNKTYSLYDMSADTIQKKIKIVLPNSKLDKDSNIVGIPVYSKNGKSYYNYGTYLMQKYYENPKLYKNAYTFIHNVCPGFYFKSTDGVGSMAYINMSQMLVYYKYTYEKTTDGVKKDTTTNVVTTFAGTEEVIQASKIEGDNGNIDTENTEYTYEKSPAGLYTELTIPVDDILLNHTTDTINSVRLSLTRINNDKKDKYAFATPQNLLLLPTDSLKDFFEGGKLPDSKISYLASYTSTTDDIGGATNAYTFHNISDLITYMRNRREKNPSDENWNKVYVIPVSTTYETINSRQQLAKVENDMSLTSTKIVRGDGVTPVDALGNKNKEDIKMKLFVVYSNFKKK